MNDGQVLERIQELVDEERKLREQASVGHADTDVHARLQSLEVNLDRCWDLLRQRRALRDAGDDPGGAHVRDETTVERYLQ
jgi:hypothetical protein